VLFAFLEHRHRDARRCRLCHLRLNGGTDIAENRHETDATPPAAQASGKGSE
jgi:hypothetical protein